MPRRLRSLLRLALLGTGAFLLALAPMLAWYVEPRVKLTPTDINVTSVMSGRGSYFDTGSGVTARNREITITRRVVGDVSDSTRSGDAVWDVSTTIDTPKTLPLGDPRKSLRWTVARWVGDRRTNRPVHCCGETPAFTGEAYLKFPFDVRKRTYLWWEETLGAAVPLRFAGTESVLGQEGYRFTGTVRPTKTGTRQVPGALVGRPKQSQVAAEQWYANAGITLVVEPRTGGVLEASIAPRVTLRAPGGGRDRVTLLQSDRLTFTPATRRAAVSRAASVSGQLRLIGETAPLTAAVIGAPLAVIGLVLLVRAGGRRPDDVSASASSG
ncbi:DUF3068 domain-containing protein [Streptomyces sp. NPDC091217]|uniref:DUF3068 domain-containing protein n=1 Tax=Streptomyces sp. NPDC091217 TaxID=3365975 RepID=UPI0038136826